MLLVYPSVARFLKGTLKRDPQRHPIKEGSQRNLQENRNKEPSGEPLQASLEREP